ARRDLPERVQTIWGEASMSALGAGVEVGEHVLLGDRPVATRGGESAQDHPGTRGQETIVEPLAALLGPERGCLGGSVAKQALRLGEQAERPGRNVGVAALD